MGAGIVLVRDGPGRWGALRCAAFVGWRVEELGRVVLGCAELGSQRVGGLRTQVRPFGGFLGAA